MPVCPNDANFAYALAPEEIPVEMASREGDGWRVRVDGRHAIAERQQIGNFADFCNDCGNCDVFCPEDGGPYLIKPRFFGTLAGWEEDRPRDGFHVGRVAGGFAVAGRFGGREYRVELAHGSVDYSGTGFFLRFAEADPAGTLAGTAAGEVDLTYFRLMTRIARALLAPSEPNYINCL